MPAKSKKKEEAPKKRIKPVVEVVEEVVEETPEEAQSSVTPKIGGVSLEPNFTKNQETGEDVTEEVVEEVVEDAPAQEIEEVVEEVVEEPSPESTVAETVEETVTEPVHVSAPTPHTKPTPEHKMSIKTILVITIISALVAAFVSGGVYVYLNGVNNLKNDTMPEDAAPVVSATPSATETPAPTAAPDINTSDYSIQVLNGSGEIGAAGRASDVAESGGFVISDTGNARNYNYEATVIQAKSSVPSDVVDLLKTTLEKSYTVEIDEDELPDSSDFDLVIIVGSD